MGKNSLKTCPFCGAAASAKHSCRSFYIECNKCRACANLANSEAAAIEKWNKRPPNQVVTTSSKPCYFCENNQASLMANFCPKCGRPLNR